MTTNGLFFLFVWQVITFQSLQKNTLLYQTHSLPFLTGIYCCKLRWMTWIPFYKILTIHCIACSKENMRINAYVHIFAKQKERWEKETRESEIRRTENGMAGRPALNNVCCTKKSNASCLLYNAFIHFKLGAERDRERKDTDIYLSWMQLQVSTQYCSEYGNCSRRG